jgi:type IV pilus assembly protein PilM
VFARYVKLPAVDSQKIYDMVRYEAQQNVPFPIEEVEWDYQILVRSAEEIEVLLVAIKKEILGEIVDAVTRAGFAVDRVDVAPMAILNAAAKNYAAAAGCTLVLDMGARSTNLIFLDGAKVFTRSIPVAGHAITQQIMKEFELGYEEAEQLKLESAVVSLGGAYEPMEDEVQEKVSKCVRGVMTRMHMEINRSINFYRGQQGGRSPERILLTGGTSIIPNADNFLAEKLGIPVEYANPFQAVAVAECIPGENIAADAHRLSEVVGLALRQVARCPVELDLMPKGILQERASQRRLPAIFAGMACLLVAVVAWGGVVHLQASRAAEDLARVQEENARLEMLSGQIKAGEDGLRTIQSEVDQVAAIAAARGVWGQYLDLIRTHIPPGRGSRRSRLGRCGTPRP